jgi:hypothetical protein
MTAALEAFIAFFGENFMHCHRNPQTPTARRPLQRIQYSKNQLYDMLAEAVANTARL